jgi:predicted DNA binding protein
MLLTKLKISAKDNIVSQLSSEMDVEVEIVRCKAAGSAGGMSILRITSRSGVTADDIKKWFTGKEGCSLVSIASVSPGKHMAMIRNSRCDLCRVLVGTECFLESGYCRGGDSVIWTVYTPNNTSIKGLIERIRNEGSKVELLSVKRASSLFELTRLQDQAMRLAVSTGYYDIPKRITLEELALRCGISKATMNLILRRAQKKILSSVMRT